MIAFLSSFFIIFVIIFILLIASIWVLYEKAGKPGWASIIPIYSIITMLKIIGKPWWWFLLMMIPPIGAIWAIWSLNLFIAKFGKGPGYTIGCIFLPFVFFPVLAFSSDTRFEDDLSDTIENW